MSNTTYGEWHTLTVGFDGEEDGKPLLDYTLDHPDTCAPADTAPDPHHWPEPRCHLDHIIREFAGEPDVYGIPPEPGTYRMRAWASPGQWFGSYYSDPEDGIEIDEESHDQETPTPESPFTRIEFGIRYAHNGLTLPIATETAERFLSQGETRGKLGILMRRKSGPGFTGEWTPQDGGPAE
ncbi:hypothetical protein [Nocardia sp. SC052]|uniref:hypothetical protein n=1 Tax=Nocardia sichangensis TaxID=3385975 RepID=UPI0039A21F0F